MDILRQVTLYSTDVVISIGPDKKIIFVNPAMEKLMQRPADHFIGTKPVLNNSANIPEEDIWRTLNEGKIWSGHILLGEAVSAPATLEILIIPIRNEKGVINGYVEIGKNITRELTTEKKFTQAQRIEALGTLAGGIAHDFNNILTGIFGYADLALRTLNDPVKTNKYVREVLEASERARQLVSQIMTFSRQADVELKPIIAKHVIHEALRLLRASIPKTIEIQATLKSNSAILADPIQLHQVVINLCANAAYAMKDDKGILEVVLEDIDVDEEFVGIHPDILPGKYIILRVSDSGCGIKPEFMDHIFDPFFTTKPRGEGTGLGLSVVHGIVQKINGIITVYSEVNKGTTINIFIPIVEPDKIEIHQQQSDDLYGGTEKIMMVDDEQAILNATQGILANFGYTVTIIADSRLALEELRKDPQGYDLIITDYMMPHLTGVELTMGIKEISSDIPVILYSGYVNKDLEEVSRSVGIGKLLRKPIGTYELIKAIRMVLDAK